MQEFRLVAALLAISLSVDVGIDAARWGSAGDDCGAPGWSVPSPPADAILVQVQAIIRYLSWVGINLMPLSLPRARMRR